MFYVWILPSRLVDPSKKVPDLNREVHLLLEVKAVTRIYFRGVLGDDTA